MVLQAASTLLKAKPTFVVVGDITALPYADEVGL
jgi:ubiquinol-cytochrome c reductase core subunit 2